MQVGHTELDPIIGVSCNFRQHACCVYKPLIWFHVAMILNHHSGRFRRCVLSQPYVGEMLKWTVYSGCMQVMWYSNCDLTSSGCKLVMSAMKKAGF